MLVAAWIAFLFVMLFLLGSAVGSFLNVCIVRLPRGRSLIRPASCCGHCHKPIRSRDNIPLLSYWLLRGRCRDCGAPFSMRYFWIELLTGLLFVLIYHFAIARNIHHFDVWSWYENDYESVLNRMFDAQLWLVFAFHALLVSLLIVAVMCDREHHRVPKSVTRWGVLLGLLASLLFPWPWPDPPSRAVVDSAERTMPFGWENKPYSWGPHVGAMPAAGPWWTGEVTPRTGLYPWPIWGPLPNWLAPGSRALGLATGLAGVFAAAVLTGLIRLLFNAGAGARAIGGGEMSLLMIAGGFLGWQPILVAAWLALIPGLTAAMRQWMEGRSQASFSVWLALAVVGVWFGWYWIGPLVQGLFFNETRLLLFVAGFATCMLVFAACLRLAVVVRPKGRS